jgi:ribosome biogenesis GTPase A
MPDIIRKIKEKIGKQTQRQDSLTDQINDLAYIAYYLGMYDAMDYINGVKTNIINSNKMEEYIKFLEENLGVACKKLVSLVSIEDVKWAQNIINDMSENNKMEKRDYLGITCVSCFYESNCAGFCGNKNCIRNKGSKTGG